MNDCNHDILGEQQEEWKDGRWHFFKKCILCDQRIHFIYMNVCDLSEDKKHDLEETMYHSEEYGLMAARKCKKCSFQHHYPFVEK